VSDERAQAFVMGWTPAGGSGEGRLEECHLAEADPGLGRLIARLVAAGGVRRFKPSTAPSDFDAIARSIVYQQLSTMAAATIYGRYVEALGGGPSPERVLATRPERLLKAGLSRAKVRYVKALASAVASGDLNLGSLRNLPDESVIESLTRVPGVGLWTAQMYLMFRLHRPDVLPTIDVGIRRGLQMAHGLRKPAAPGYVSRSGSRWAPYRSLACVYLWAALEPGAVGPDQVLATTD
jgi:3-methyladenine DNA glycosylase/8-oxoguanine DNA glycosylase